MAYFTKRYHLPGTAPGTLVETDSAVQAGITLVDYTATQYQEEVITAPAFCQPFLQRDSTTWINIQGN